MPNNNIQQVMQAVQSAQQAQQAIQEAQLNANPQQMQAAQQQLEQASKNLQQAKSRYGTQLNAEQRQLIQLTQQQLTNTEVIVQQNQSVFNPS